MFFISIRIYFLPHREPFKGKILETWGKGTTCLIPYNLLFRDKILEKIELCLENLENDVKAIPALMKQLFVDVDALIYMINCGKSLISEAKGFWSQSVHKASLVFSERARSDLLAVKELVLSSKVHRMHTEKDSIRKIVNDDLAVILDDICDDLEEILASSFAPDQLITIIGMLYDVPFCIRCVPPEKRRRNSLKDDFITYDYGEVEQTCLDYCVAKSEHLRLACENSFPRGLFRLDLSRKWKTQKLKDAKFFGFLRLDENSLSASPLSMISIFPLEGSKGDSL